MVKSIPARASQGLLLLLLWSTFGHAVNLPLDYGDHGLFISRTSQLEKIYAAGQGAVDLEEQLLHHLDIGTPEIVLHRDLIEEYKGALSAQFRDPQPQPPAVPKDLRALFPQLKNRLTASSHLNYRRLLGEEKREQLYRMEKDFAREIGLSHTEVFPLIALILNPASVVDLARQNLLKTFLRTNAYEDSLRELFLERLFPILPVVAFKIKARADLQSLIRQALLTSINAEDSHSFYVQASNVRFRFLSANYEAPKDTSREPIPRPRSREVLRRLASDYLFALDQLHVYGQRIAVLTPSDLSRTALEQIYKLSVELTAELKTLPSRLVARDGQKLKGVPKVWKSSEWATFSQSHESQVRSVTNETWEQIISEAEQALALAQSLSSEEPTLLDRLRAAGTYLDCLAALSMPQENPASRALSTSAR